MQATWGIFPMDVLVREILKQKKSKLPAKKNKPCHTPSRSDREREEKEREESFNKMIDPKAVRLYYWQHASLFWEHRCWSNIFGPWSNLIC